jgi:hypothetical protein
MTYLTQPDIGREPGIWRTWLFVSYPLQKP